MEAPRQLHIVPQEGQCGTPELARVSIPILQKEGKRRSDTENDDNIVVSFSRFTFSIPSTDWRPIDSSVSVSLALMETEYTSACVLFLNSYSKFR